MKYKTILFDFDGTLADSLPICIYSFQQVFNKYDGKNLSREDIIEMFGPSEVGIIQQNLINREKINQAIEDYYFYYDSEHSNLVKVNEEIIKMLYEIKNKGIQFGIVTGKARKSYEISSNHLFPNNMFKVSITGDEVINPKPHPEGILLAMKMLNSSLDETLFIGDSSADIEAGIRANIKTVGVNWLENSHGSKFTVKPDYEFSSVDMFMKEFFK